MLKPEGKKSKNITHKNGSTIRVRHQSLESAKKPLAKHLTKTIDETREPNAVTGVNGPIVQQSSHGPNIWKVSSKKREKRDMWRLMGRYSYARWTVSGTKSSRIWGGGYEEGRDVTVGKGGEFMKSA